MNLEQLHAEMSGCTRCFDAGYQVVPGAVFSGQIGAQVMLIGQAPGVTEVEAKRPFNASSGKRLFQWLAQSDWDETDFRTHQYMGAVTKCYPGKHPNGKGDRVPSKAEQALCRPFLEQEIRLIQPKLMLLVGKLSIGMLFPSKTKLTDIIGTAIYFPPETLAADALQFDLSAGQQVGHFDPDRPAGRYVVPLPHPSGASLWPNKPENKRLIEQAMLLIQDIREGWSLSPV